MVFQPINSAEDGLASILDTSEESLCEIAQQRKSQTGPISSKRRKDTMSLESCIEEQGPYSELVHEKPSETVW